MKLSFLINNLISQEKVIISDYSFLKEIIKNSVSWNENRISSITLLDKLKDFKSIDYYGNKIDFRFIEHSELLEEKKYKLNYNLYNKYDFIICSTDNVNTHICNNSIKLNSRILSNYWQLLSNGIIINIVNGESDENIEFFWKNKLLKIPDIKNKWLIIQEPFLFDKYGDHSRNIIEIIKNIKANKYYFITRANNQFNHIKEKFLVSLNRNNINYEIIEYPEKKREKKKIHKRFIITNNFLLTTGDSFGFFNTKENKVSSNEEITISTIYNKFDSFKNIIHHLHEIL